MLLETITALYIGFNTMPFVGTDIQLISNNTALRFDNKIHLQGFNQETKGFNPYDIRFKMSLEQRINKNFLLGYEHNCFHSFQKERRTIDVLSFNGVKYYRGTDHRFYLEINQ